MKKIITLCLILVFLSSCSISDFTKPVSKFWSYITTWSRDLNSKNTPESIINVSVVKDHSSRSFFASDDGGGKHEKFLKETIAVNAKAIPLQSLLKSIMPKWIVRMPEKFSDVMVDAVIQTTRKQAIFDILTQINAQADFYTKTKPNPILVIYEK
jgi:hypothetical protein